MRGGVGSDSSEPQRPRTNPMVKRRDLERHLRRQGCRLVREGGKHSIWENPVTEQRSTVPRHREIPRGTSIAICRQLDVDPFP